MFCFSFCFFQTMKKNSIEATKMMKWIADVSFKWHPMRPKKVETKNLGGGDKCQFFCKDGQFFLLQSKDMSKKLRKILPAITKMDVLVVEIISQERPIKSSWAERYAHPHKHTHLHPHPHTHTHTHTLTHTYTRTHLHSHAPTLTNTITHTHLHSRTPTLIHTYTHTHLHSHTLSSIRIWMKMLTS